MMAGNRGDFKLQVIPVIDLKGGQVVHAKGGNREAYPPLVSRLCQGSTPMAVVGGYLKLFSFTSLYVADLDAIEQEGDNDRALFEIRRAYPGLDLWVDRGVSSVEAARDWLETGLGRVVIGSESQKDHRLLEVLTRDKAASIILSLDFRGEQFLGPDSLLERSDLWPPMVIVMTLARVGGQAGPDLERLKFVRGLAENRKVFAAGGLRDAEDLLPLKQAGATGILVASALHDGRLKASHLTSL